MGKTDVRETGFLDRSVRLGDRDFFYQIFVPRGYTPNRLWPLILFLHGSGERGDDGILQTHVGLGSAIRRQAQRFPSIVIFPQVPLDQSWQTPTMVQLAISTARMAMQEFRVDPGRLYLTGISMGGTGIWSISSRHPGLFAALLPVCGGLQFPAAEGGEPNSSSNLALCADIAKHVGRTPVWIFHGAQDPIVPVTYSRLMDEALKFHGCPVRYTEFEQCGHGVWDKVYDNPEVCSWLFAQVKK